MVSPRRKSLNLLSSTRFHECFYEVKSVIADCEDASDNKFLELAIDAKSKVIVSGDRHLRGMNPFQ